MMEILGWLTAILCFYLAGAFFVLGSNWMGKDFNKKLFNISNKTRTYLLVSIIVVIIVVIPMFTLQVNHISSLVDKVFN